MAYRVFLDGVKVVVECDAVDEAIELTRAINTLASFTSKAPRNGSSPRGRSKEAPTHGVDACVLEALKSCGQSGSRAIAEAANVPLYNTKKSLKALQRAGHAKAIGTGSGRMWVAASTKGRTNGI